MKIVRSLLKMILPPEWYSRVSHASAILRGFDYGFLSNPTYAEDGLITFHVCRFMQDPLFNRAYAIGKKTGGLRTHPGDIHWRAYVACWAAIRARYLDGDFVECGVSLGLLSRTVAEYVDLKNIDKKFYLFDTFNGIPEECLTVEEKQKGIDNSVFGYDDCYEAVKRTFSEFPNVLIIRGKVPESLAMCGIERVAYLSIDMNNAASEIAAAEYFWEKLVPGAVIVLDDYAYSEQFSLQHAAFDEFCRNKGASVLALPTGQGLIFKP